MTEEFDLSEKIVYWRDKGFVPANSIHIEDVKEFIRRLKEIISTQEETDLDVCIWLKNQIDKLAGNRLR